MAQTHAETLAPSRTSRRRLAWVRVNRHWAVPILLLLMAGAWELASLVVTTPGVNVSPRVPGWDYVFTDGLKGLSNYWKGGLGAESTLLGGPETYWGAVLAIAYNSLLTAERLVLGLALGAFVGIGLGILFSAFPRVWRLSAMSATLLRMVPMLALIKLFQIWFGASTTGVIVFVGYGIAIILFVATLHAIANVPRRYEEYAYTLGASRWHVYRSVILPAALPELATTLALCLGMAWTLVLGAEFLGVEDGLGRILIAAGSFAYTGRMVVVALVLILYTSLSTLALRALLRRILRWMPQQG